MCVRMHLEMEISVLFFFSYCMRHRDVSSVSRNWYESEKKNVPRHNIFYSIDNFLLGKEKPDMHTGSEKVF